MQVQLPHWEPGMDRYKFFWMAFVACVLLVQPAHATDTPEEEDLMNEFAFLEDSALVELAARHKQDIGMSPSAISVITREDIDASGAETIADLLRMVPGMEVVLSSPFFFSVSARLNRNTENHLFLVLIDGRQANDELIGATMFHVQPIFLDDIERIEVIRGPVSSLYGTNALAGVISITTRGVPQQTSGWARVSAGEPGLIMAAARGSAMIGEWGVSLSGGGDRSGTFVDYRMPGRRTWMFRAVAERHFSEEGLFLVEAGISRGEGRVTTAMGMLNFVHDLRTVRLRYQDGDLQGQLCWVQSPLRGSVGNDLVFSGVRLAEIKPTFVDAHTLEGEVQWKLPRFYDPLVIIVGGLGRGSYVTSDDFIDEGYADVTSPYYHKPGTETRDGRAGIFVHGELAPINWMTVTGGVRLDYNNITGFFLSPRLAAVFQPVAGQFTRMGVARAFRAPSFQEARLHFQVGFPDDSPITGPGQNDFQEFLSRSVGNSSLDSEELLAFEAGYLGKFLDGRLAVSLDLYYNIYSKFIDFRSDMVMGERGLPDLRLSQVQFFNVEKTLNIVGGELGVRYNPTKHLSLLASWAHREELDYDTAPKNILTLGGRFRTGGGLLGSLYMFYRSGSWERGVENPEGIMAPTTTEYLDQAMLFLGKLGWVWETGKGFDLETGLKLFLPFSPFSGRLFNYYERGGGETAYGQYYGGLELGRSLTAYLQGSF